MKNTFALIRSTMKTAYRLNKTAVILTVLSSLIGAINPYVTILLSAYILDGLPASDGVLRLLRVVVAGISIVFALNFFEKYINKINTVQIDICVRKFNMEMGKKTLTMDFELVESPLVNEIRNRIKNDHSWGAGFYSVFWQLSWLLGSFFSLITGFIVMFPLFLTGNFFAHWSTPIYFLALIAITIASALFNANYVNKKSFELMDETSKARNYFGYFMWGGIDYKSGKDIRIYDASNIMKSYMEDTDEWKRTWINKFTKLNIIGGFTGGLSSGVLQGGAYLFVVLRAVRGALSVGSVIKYATTIYNFANNLSSFMDAVSNFAVTSKRQQSTLDYIGVKDVLYHGTIPVEKRSDNEYEIEFKNVSFKYPGSEGYALKNLNLKLNIGQRMAVVGMNGSGKTTMIKLLCRLYDPTEGEITLNGINIKKYNYNEYMSIFSVVFQDFKLFSFSLGQNVATSKDYDPTKAVEVLDKAGFSKRFSTMPKGLDTPLYKDYEEGGVEISGGEAQKIAIARALYKDAPFIVLDEPTAALDPIAEFEVYSKFNEIVGNKTAIYISHRLSSCRFCDDIAVFHEGRLIQRGSHIALIADQKGKYHELWNAQAQYYSENA
jgi:ATP-binding cassette, subfamily B, bacterial